MVAGAFALLSVSWVAAFQATPDADLKEAMATMASGRLSPDDVASLERKVVQSDDFLAHAQLYLYYDGQIKSARAGTAETRKARLDHAFWVLEYHPESLTAGFLAQLDQPTQDLREPAEVVERATAIWNQALKDRSNNARVVANAGRFFQNRDRARSLDLLERALGLKPDDQYIEQALGEAYAYAFLGVDRVEFNGWPKTLKDDPVLGTRNRCFGRNKARESDGGLCEYDLVSGIDIGGEDEWEGQG